MRRRDNSLNSPWSSRHGADPDLPDHRCALAILDERWGVFEVHHADLADDGSLVLTNPQLFSHLSAGARAVGHGRIRPPSIPHPDVGR